MISLKLSNLQKKKSRFLIATAILLILLIGILLIAFSINNKGTLTFLIAIKPNENLLAYLSIGIVAIACIIVGISLNLSGEAAQSITRNQLASPFTLGLTSSITLSYIFLSLPTTNFSIYYVALISIFLLFFINILPIYLISNSKYKKQTNSFIFYGLSATVLVSSFIDIFNRLRNPIDFNIYGWLEVGAASITDDKLICGSIFFILGLILFLSIIKKIYLLENNYFKASTMGVNAPLINMLGLIAIGLMSIGGSIAYAPLTLVGFATPYLTKRFIIKNYDIRYSIIPSSILSVIVTELSFVISLYLKVNLNIVMVLVLSPIILWMIFERPKRYAQFH